MGDMSTWVMCLRGWPGSVGSAGGLPKGNWVFTRNKKNLRPRKEQ